MRWTGDRSDIEDMRGRSGFGGGMMPLGLGGFVVVLLLSWVSGTNLFSLLGSGTQSPTAVGTSGQVNSSPTEERLADFVGAVSKDVQDMWADRLGAQYEGNHGGPVRHAVPSACRAGGLGT